MSTKESAFKDFLDLTSAGMEFGELAIIIQTPDMEYHVVDLELADWQNSPLLQGEFCFVNCTKDSPNFHFLDLEKAGITTVDDLDMLIRTQEESGDAFAIFVKNYPQNLVSLRKFHKYYQGHAESKKSFAEEKLREHFEQECTNFDSFAKYVTFDGEQYFADHYSSLKIYKSMTVKGGYHFFLP